MKSLYAFLAITALSATLSAKENVLSVEQFNEFFSSMLNEKLTSDMGTCLNSSDSTVLKIKINQSMHIPFYLATVMNGEKTVSRFLLTPKDLEGKAFEAAGVIGEAQKVSVGTLTVSPKNKNTFALQIDGSLTTFNCPPVKKGN